MEEAGELYLVSSFGVAAQKLPQPPYLVPMTGQG